MTDLTAALEATALAQALKASRWVYPFINAAHIFGLALLVGAIMPMGLARLGLVRGITETALRPFALAGLILVILSGGLLFVTQASDYASNDLFRTKMALVALALLNAAAHLRLGGRSAVYSVASLVLWPTILLLGRLVGYSG